MNTISKHFLFVFILTLALASLCSTFIFPHPAALAAPTLTTYSYARAETSGTYIYKSPTTTDPSNILFEIPETYFVGLISNYNTNFYKVMYRDQTGFVQKSSVTAVKETPATPYLENITFRVFVPGGAELVANPTSKSPTVITTVEQNTTLKYYGKTFGQESISGRGSTWYFCQTPTGEWGYIYKGLTDQLSHIALNTERTTAASPFEDSGDYLYNLIDLSSGYKILIILLTTLPIGLLIYLLQKPYKIEKNLTSHTPKRKLRPKAINQIQDQTDNTI